MSIYQADPFLGYGFKKGFPRESHLSEAWRKKTCALGKVGMAKSFPGRGTEGQHAAPGDQMGRNTRIERRTRLDEKEVSLTFKNSVATLRSLDFVLRAIGSHWKILSKGVTRSDLYLKKITLVLVWRTHRRESWIERKIVNRCCKCPSKRLQ